MKRSALFVFSLITIACLSNYPSEAEGNHIDCNSNGNERARLITFRVETRETDHSRLNDEAATSRIFEGAKNFALTYCVRQSKGRLKAHDIQEVKIILIDENNSDQLAYGTLTFSNNLWKITNLVANPTSNKGEGARLSDAGSPTQSSVTDDLNDFTRHFPVPSSGIEPTVVSIIEKVADDAFLRCGDSWFLSNNVPTNRKDRWSGAEYNGKFSFGVAPRRITQADRLNGLSWSYAVAIKFYGSSRRYGPGPSWSQWFDVGTPLKDDFRDSPLTYEIKKLGGTIYLNISNAGSMPISSYKRKLNYGCNDIPK